MSSFATAVTKRAVAGVWQKAREFEDWGGPLCRDYIGANAQDMHVKEGIAWMAVAWVTYFVLDIRRVFKGFATTTSSGSLRRKQEPPLKKSAMGPSSLEFFLASIHLAMFAMLFYWKWQDRCLIVLLQPCHIILVLEAVALLTGNNAIAVLVLPALTGTGLAMVVPGTSGLDAVQTTAYWAQHVLIQIVPIYLLCRHDFAALRLCSLRTVLAGVWILQIAHWLFYLPIDVALEVNVEFMLCPTLGMRDAFELFPKTLFWPTYRTTLTVFVAILCFFVAYTYIVVASLLRWVIVVVARERSRQDSVSTTFRIAVEEDAEEVMRITNEAFIADKFFKLEQYWSRFDLATVKTMMATRDGVFIVKQETNDGVIGSIFLNWETMEIPGTNTKQLTGHISAVSVPTRFARKGVGKGLVQAAELHLQSVAKASGMSSVVMEMGVINLREDLFPFYESQGYERLGEMRPNNAELERIVRPGLDVCCVKMRKGLQ